ncbi:MAG: NAD(P)-dependent oxidoreductase [Chitinophagaceae bacterium]
MSRILLTGATGFLGANLLKRLVTEHDVAILSREVSSFSRISDLSSQIKNYRIESNSIDSIVESFRPEVIIHCATDYGRKAVPPMQIVEANLILPLKLIHAAGQFGVKKFINTDTFLDKGVSHYSLSKRQFLEWFKTYADRMVCVNMVLEHFYGPYDDKTKFVSFVINELLCGRERIPLTLGTQKRNFIFIEDVVEAFMTVLDFPFGQDNGFKEFFIASEQTITIRNLVEHLKHLCKNTNTLLDFGALPFRPNEIMDSSVDISAIKALGWKPAVTLEEGLRYTVESELSDIKT